MKTLTDLKINRLKMGRKSLKTLFNGIFRSVKTLTSPNLGSLKPTSGQKLVWNFPIDNGDFSNPVFFDRVQIEGNREVKRQIGYM